MRRAFVVLILGAVVSIGLTACGGKGSNSPSTTTTPALTPKGIYEQKMQILGQQIDSVMGAVSNANNSQTPSGQPLPGKTEAANLLIAQKELVKASAQLAKIKPPAALKADQATLLKGVREVATELTPVIAQLKQKGSNPIKVLQGILKFQGLKDMQRASAAIAKSGYDILGTGTPAGNG
ncbi:MAG TPA: hypothetical protein VG652_06490 [Gaiellaceae bacterium]|nr:hypothetical protein [Gaiellaceae bacterium]